MKYDKEIGIRVGARKDLTGLRFGKLVVCKLILQKKGHSYFECECDCGNKVEVKAANLKTKTLVEKSCGCVPLLSHPKCNGMIGQRFGKLVVSARSENRVSTNKTESRWKCQCDCGNEVVVSGHSLRKRKTNSCGCLFTEFVHSMDLGLAAKRYSFRVTKAVAERRKIPWKLTFEDYVLICEQECSYCGSRPSQVQDGARSLGKLRKHNGSWTHHGIDRIDNNKGYEEGNATPCCKICNVAKLIMSVEEFSEQVECIYNFTHGLTVDKYAQLPLRNGNGYVKSSVFDDLAGENYGHLKVIKRVCSINSHSFYECICDCGNRIELFGYQLKHTKIKSCGCVGRKHSVPTFTIDDVQRSFFILAKNKSGERNITFDLDLIEFINISEKKCTYCGRPPNRLIQTDKHGNGWMHGGIDRKDSSIGYVSDNVVPCCEHCNMMKASLSINEFLSHIDKIMVYRNSPPAV